MSECPEFHPLTHHTLMVNEGQIDSKLLDIRLGLSWRNQSVDDMLEWACVYEEGDCPEIAKACLNAALLKENAIKNGINLEDRIDQA